MKYYKKFYEIGNNKYYTITADDEEFIATESFINLGKKNIFGKQKTLTQGLKLLKLTAPLAVLFDCISSAPESTKQKYDSEDLTSYVIPKNTTVLQEIRNVYDVYTGLQIKEVDENLEEVINLLKERYKGQELEEKIDHYTKKAEGLKKQIESVDPLNKYDLDNPEHTAGNIIKTMLREGINHLYTESIGAFLKHSIMYECDEFGTLTIYRVSTIKNVVKGVETFKYDRNVLKALVDSAEINK